jgi:Flp pilus assembly protein protease CpaA
VIIVFLAWKGLLLNKIKRLGTILMSLVLLRSHSGAFSTALAAPRTAKKEGIPYAVALALGMAVLCYGHFTG